MTNYDPRRPTEAPPTGYRSACWFAGLAVVLIIIGIFLWGSGEWDHKGTNTAANPPSSSGTTTGAAPAGTRLGSIAH
jgi:hypothetical protein